MEDPAKEIEQVVVSLTTAVNPEIQKATLLKYYTPNASFRHPLCVVSSSSSPPSRDAILAIYQWYRVLSPHIKMNVRDITWDESKETLFVECEQVFHIRWSPFKPQPARLLVRLKLRKQEVPGENTTKYFIQSQEDFYHPDDLAAIVLPPLVPFVHLALRFGTFASGLNTKVFALLGYWRVKDGEGGKGVILQPSGEPSATASGGGEQNGRQECKKTE